MTLYEELVANNIPIDHHASDLYFKVTVASMAILKRHLGQAQKASIFTSQLDGTQWYEVNFAYDPFWEGKL